MTQSRNGHYYRQLRLQILAIYNHCHLCGRPVNKQLSGKHKWGPTLDHITPVNHGGRDTLHNSRLAHNYCNGKRGDMPIEQWHAQHPITKAW